MTDPVEVVSQKTPPPPNNSYSASAITLFGVPFLGIDASIGTTYIPMYVAIVASTSAPVNLMMALVYGYAYQGHCYDLPEPMVVVVDTPGQLAVGCGYGPPPAFAQPYLMWQVEKLERTVLIQSANDTFEEVILKRNLMGAKQPLSYRSASLISHRGGKLTEFE